MAPKAAVEKMKYLKISPTEKGSQDHQSLLDCYKKFNKHLTEENIERPVVMLVDEHSSSFDFKILQYLRENQIFLFVNPTHCGEISNVIKSSMLKSVCQG